MAETVEASVEGLGGAVGGAVVEVGQDIVAAPVQGPAERGEFVAAGL